MILKELNVFHQLQKLFDSLKILIHFDEKRQFYADLNVSKKFEFEVHVYHLTNSLLILQASGQKLQQLILFLSRLLTDAEMRYWFIELKIADMI